MQGARRLICVICMILILIFAIIHLGVSISILVKFRNYGDVFRPERGLAAFNIVITIYAFMIGGFGLFSVLTDRGNLSAVVALATIVLVVFALVSLITALIINSLAINYVGSRFSNHINNYKQDPNSRDIVNRIQIDYNCCGDNTWLDWTSVGLNATGSGTSTRAPSSTTTQVSASNTTTVSASNTTAVSASATTTGSTGVTTATTVPADVTTTITQPAGVTTITTQPVSVTIASGTTADITTSVGPLGSSTASSGKKRDIELKLFNNGRRIADKSLTSWERITNFLNSQETSYQALRQKRQTQSDYSGMYGLPSSFNVTLPQSCCTNDLSTATDLSNLYCISNGNNISNSFHTDGCAKQLSKRSVGQTLGLAVINSFLVILALAAIPALIETDPFQVPPQNGHVNQSTQRYQPTQQYQPTQRYQPTQQFQPVYQYPQQFAYGGSSAPAYNPGISYNTYNPTYSSYY